MSPWISLSRPLKDLLNLKIIQSIAARLPKRPAAYLCLFIAWGITLWFLSAGHPVPKDTPDIPHLDKLAHFSYFFGGGLLLATFSGLRFSDWSHRRIFLSVLLLGCLIGRLDEYHQTFTPGRSGNDPWDWLADTIGIAAGAWVSLVVLLPQIKFLRKRIDQNH